VTLLNRREFGALAVGLAGSLALGTACRASQAAKGGNGRLRARPRPGRPDATIRSGPLGLDGDRDAILFIPERAPENARPLLVLLHGAGGSGSGILQRLRRFADDAGVVVLAPDSRGSTWDAIRDGFGPDVVFLDRALSRVFESVDVDPARVSIGGFSDGATYAISLGLLNGNLFPRVLAYSPGFFVGGLPEGKPRFFISHGTADQVLPIDRCSRVIVRKLEQQGYDVTFRPFEDGHTIPPHIALAGMKWVAAR
jgi:phospholipase/carboxylesterase